MAYGTNHNGRNAFGKCVSKMARLKNDEAREAAVARIDRAAGRCTERATTGHGHGHGHGHAKGHDKSKRGHGENMRACLSHAA
jgi:hypothetical protein